MSLHPTKVIIVPPDSKYIPAGKFLDIDQKYYQKHDKERINTHEAYGRQGKPLLPHGKNVSYQATNFVQKSPVLPLGHTLNPNYNTYIYNQLTGSNPSHRTVFV
jgi:hypothetical protein